MIYKLHQKIKKMGFTLIETLVAVLILSVALTGPLTIAAKSLSSALIAKDQIAAFFLAQDAVEYVRFKRDTNALGAAPWLGGLDYCIGADGCQVDSIQDAITACSGTCSALRYNATQNWYSYDSTDALTIFTRTVKLAAVTSNTNEESLTVTVSWKDSGNVARSVVVHENITNWQ